MSDLISKKSLKDRASECALSEDEYKRFCEIIDAEPIAYSVEGVAHELSKLKHTDIASCDNYIDKIYGYCKQCDRTILVDKAIEIVKDGGMSAVCEEEFEEVE